MEILLESSLDLRAVHQADYDDGDGNSSHTGSHHESRNDSAVLVATMMKMMESPPSRSRTICYHCRDARLSQPLPRGRNGGGIN